MARLSNLLLLLPLLVPALAAPVAAPQDVSNPFDSSFLSSLASEIAASQTLVAAPTATDVSGSPPLADVGSGGVGFDDLTQPEQGIPFPVFTTTDTKTNGKAVTSSSGANTVDTVSNLDFSTPKTAREIELVAKRNAKNRGGHLGGGPIIMKRSAETEENSVSNLDFSTPKTAREIELVAKRNAKNSGGHGGGSFRLGGGSIMERSAETEESSEENSEGALVHTKRAPFFRLAAFRHTFSDE